MPITYQELRRCAALAREADRLREQIIRMRAKLEGVSPSPMGTPRGGGVTDVIGRAIAVLDATERKWLRVIEEYTAMMLRVEAAIAGVDNPDHRTVLRMRYLDGERWADIAQALRYSERQCRRMCTAAEQNMSNNVHPKRDIMVSSKPGRATRAPRSR